MPDKEIEYWFSTNSGAHIPVYKGEDKNTALSRYIKERQIASNKQEGEILNKEEQLRDNRKQGISDEYIVTQYPQPANIDQVKEKYFNLLKDAGVYGTDDQIDNYLKDRQDWREMEWRREAQEQEDWGYKKVTAAEFKKMKYSDIYDSYMDFNEYKKVFSDPTILTVPGTLSEGLEIYYRGASKNGYGQYTKGADARQIWDDKYKFSEFLDKHPELHLNTSKTLYRGIRVSDKGLKDLQKAYDKGQPIDFWGPSSWSMNEYTAKEFGNYSLVGKKNKNICIFEEVGGGKHKAMPFVYGHDAEVIYSGNTEFDIVSITQNEEGLYYVKVKERKG